VIKFVLYVFNKFQYSQIVPVLNGQNTDRHTVCNRASTFTRIVLNTESSQLEHGTF